MDYFISNYTTTNWWESPGVSSDALWGTPLYIPAADIIQADPSLIDSVQGAELVNSINARE